MRIASTLLEIKELHDERLEYGLKSAQFFNDIQRKLSSLGYLFSRKPHSQQTLSCFSVSFNSAFFSSLFSSLFYTLFLTYFNALGKTFFLTLIFRCINRVLDIPISPLTCLILPYLLRRELGNLGLLEKAVEDFIA